jgi:hypothetical protein
VDENGSRPREGRGNKKKRKGKEKKRKRERKRKRKKKEIENKKGKDYVFLEIVIRKLYYLYYYWIMKIGCVMISES